jgi:hypothetical protein
LGVLGYGTEEEYVRKVLAVVHTAERVTSPGVYLVDTLPWLYLPEWMTGSKSEGERLYGEELDLFRRSQNDVCEEMKNGDMKSKGNGY